MNRICSVVLDKCPCVDPPVLNLSSEAPDPLVFVGRVYDPFNPWKPNRLTPYVEPPGTMHDCNGVVYSYTSQTAADLLAKISGIICDQDGVLDGDQSVTGMQYASEEQVATKTCSNGATSTFTVPAGYFVSPLINPGDGAAWLAAANAAALSYAQQQVSLQSPCIDGGGVDPSGTGGGGPIPQPKLPDKSNWCCLGETLSDVFYSLSGPNSAADYIFTVTGGSLPPGTVLDKIDNNTAELAGVPTVPGTYTFQITAVRSDLNWMGAVATVTFYVFGMTTATPLPTGTVGTFYSEQLMTAGGTAPVTFALGVGSTLPVGLTLDASGLISGTPTVATP